VVDPVNFETLMKVCPMIRFVGIRHSLSAIRTQMKAKAWLSQLNTGWNRVPAGACDRSRQVCHSNCGKVTSRRAPLVGFALGVAARSSPRPWLTLQRSTP
jgi:hypothetical protein